jgi:NitT/TauT family transport system permease protein
MMNSLRNTFMDVYKSRLYPNHWDMIALLFVLGVITLLAWDAKQMAAPYELGKPILISLNPHNLPGYAMRTVMRMFIALFFSLLFTFTIATLAAKNRRAGRIIIPMIDILQSVPILGFLSISVVGFIRLFPNSLLGPECAAIFVIFTSQAWNMALGFYQTLRLVPAELKEAADMYHLSAWQRFWRIDVPFSMPGLLWNTMMSMSAGWFFVVASEAISVSNQQILLPGIGSYIAMAIEAADLRAIGYAILTMFIVIMIYDQLLFRPLVAWAEKFKSDPEPSEREPRSWMINFLNRTRFLRYLGGKIEQAFEAMVNISFFRRSQENFQKRIHKRTVKQKHFSEFVWNAMLIILLVSVLGFAGRYVYQNIPLHSVVQVFVLGLITALRVAVLIVLCSLLWVPVGVWIGMRPNVAYIAQPIAQFFAAFPANLFYPIVVVLIVTFHLNPEIWLTPLMILGAQWYILFNVVAGASQIPKDLQLVADNFGVSVWLRWKRLILPAIFPYYITGAITAAGGAWNASIVAEVVSWGNTKLRATGLGAYISEYTALGDFSHIALGIGMMCILVLILNRFIWRPLYVLAETRFLFD